ncbi:hypothetical protein SAMN02745174_02270 [Cetobacterium ceti]|uniref:Uncharacterized protein n=1 Tax=Cetobacterium ceti TaxID=180163 RepID=A0A1T4QC74_9FUSO|nr:hypothetical protein [Cetobacterium ceti]SKA01390.1 hypothetical protein SAMN02745174_02270 [Cetobacterium ceti]
MLIQLQKKEFIELLNTIEKFGLEEVIKRKEKLTVLPFGYQYSHPLKLIDIKVICERDAEAFFVKLHENLNAETIEVPGVGMKSPRYFVEKQYGIKLKKIL